MSPEHTVLPNTSSQATVFEKCFKMSLLDSLRHLWEMTVLDKSKVGNFGYFWSKLLTIFKIFKHLNSILECRTVLLTYFGMKVVSSWTTFLLTIWEIVGPFLYLKHVRKADFLPAETSFFSLRSWNLPSTFRPFWPLEKNGGLSCVMLFLMACLMM